MDLYDDCGYDVPMFEDGAWVTIERPSGEYRIKIRGEDSRVAKRVWADILLSYGERDFQKEPMDPKEDFRAEVQRVANGVIVDWEGDNWIDPETREPIPYSPDDAERVLYAAGEMLRSIKRRSQQIGNFRQKATKAAAGNSSRRSSSRRTGSASRSTVKSNGAPESAPNR